MHRCFGLYSFIYLWYHHFISRAGPWARCEGSTGVGSTWLLHRLMSKGWGGFYPPSAGTPCLYECVHNGNPPQILFCWVVEFKQHQRTPDIIIICTYNVQVLVLQLLWWKTTLPHVSWWNEGDFLPYSSDLVLWADCTPTLWTAAAISLTSLLWLKLLSSPKILTAGPAGKQRPAERMFACLPACTKNIFHAVDRV